MLYTNAKLRHENVIMDNLVVIKQIISEIVECIKTENIFGKSPKFIKNLLTNNKVMIIWTNFVVKMKKRRRNLF